MPGRWTISLNGGATLDGDALDLAVQELHYPSKSTGMATFSVRRGASDAFLCQPGNGPTPPDVVRLYLDGVCQWCGPVAKSTKVVSDSAVRHLHHVADPWRILETSTFIYWVGLTAPVDTPCSNAGWWIAKQFWDGLAGSSRWLQMEYWQPSVPGAFYEAWMNTPGPLANVLTNLLSPAILACTRWDMTTNPPTLKVRNQGDEVVTLDVDDDGIVGAINLTPRTDLIPAGIAFLTQSSGTGYGVMSSADYFTGDPTVALYPPGTVAGAERVLTLFNTQNLYPSDAQGGAARALFQAFSQVIWEGSFMVQMDECRTDLKPGMTVNIVRKADASTVDAAWATMAAVVQSVTVDAFTRHATVQVGSSSVLEPTTVFDRMRWMMAMWPYNEMWAKLPRGSALSAVPGTALGRQGSATVASIVTTTLGGTLNVVAQIGPDTIAGLVAVDLYYPTELFPATFTLTLGATPALSATVALVRAGLIRISIGSGATPTPGTLVSWTVTVNP